MASRLPGAMDSPASALQWLTALEPTLEHENKVRAADYLA